MTKIVAQFFAAALALAPGAAAAGSHHAASPYDLRGRL